MICADCCMFLLHTPVYHKHENCCLLVAYLIAGYLLYFQGNLTGTRSYLHTWVSYRLRDEAEKL